MSMIIARGIRSSSIEPGPGEEVLEGHELLTMRRGIGADGKAWHLDTDSYNRFMNMQFYRGVFINPDALRAAHSTDVSGAYAVVLSTGTFWIWSSEANAWIDTAVGATDSQGLPPGGTEGQFLGKVSDADGDVDWLDISSIRRDIHNDLSGLQGGNATERFHLTREDADRVASGVVDWSTIINVPGSTIDTPGFLRISTIPEVLEGTDNTTAVSPLGLQAKIDALPSSVIDKDIADALDNANNPSKDNPFATIDDLQNAGVYSVPKGGIIMWSGMISAIPTGWALCDGTNNTPNLTNRFVMGTNGVATNPGDNGGNNSMTLAVSNIPSHSHSASGGSHTHGMTHTHSMSGLSAASAGGHDHDTVSNGYSVPCANQGFGRSLFQAYGSVTYKAVYVNDSSAFTNGYRTGSGGSHSHSVTGSLSSYSGVTDSSAPSVSVGYTGNGVAFDNRPQYYALAFIMKL